MWTGTFAYDFSRIGPKLNFFFLTIFFCLQNSEILRESDDDDEFTLYLMMLKTKFKNHDNGTAIPRETDDPYKTLYKKTRFSFLNLSCLLIIRKR